MKTRWSRSHLPQPFTSGGRDARGIPPFACPELHFRVGVVRVRNSAGSGAAGGFPVGRLSAIARWQECEPGRQSCSAWVLDVALVLPSELQGSSAYAFSN